MTVHVPHDGTGSQALDEVNADRRAVRLASIATLTLMVCGAIAIPSVKSLSLRYYSLFYEQYAAIEGPALAIVAVFAIATLVLLATSRTGSVAASTAEVASVVTPQERIRLYAWLLAIAAFVVSVVGTDVIFHRYFLADDEYSAWFQAVIFAHGKWSAAVAPEWCRWIKYLTPTSISTPQPCTWHLGFLPIHSLIRAGFMSVGADRFAGPTFGAISILLVGAIARRQWPARPHRVWIAMIVLACSTQALVMSMTMYSMPTHLVFALIWLWLYVVDERWSVVILPWVGALALGVHSPFPHLMLVPPFLLRYVWRRRYMTALYVAAVYGIAIVWWRAQLTATSGAAPSLSAAASTAAATPGGLFRVPDVIGVYSHTMSSTLIATWNMPIAVICVLAAGLTWRRLDGFSRDAALSLALTMVLRAFTPPFMDGEGWGYRYVYAGLGLFALLTAVGTEVVASAVGGRRARLLFAGAVACAVLVQLPMRAVQTEGIVRPHYRAYQLLHQQKEKIVVFRASDFLWARQLVRNDPFLKQGPFIMDMPLSASGKIPAGCSQSGVHEGTEQPSQRAQQLIADVCSALRTVMSTKGPEVELQRLYPGQVRIIKPDELAAVGLTRFQPGLVLNVNRVPNQPGVPRLPR
jgi:hypothetical protein